MLTRCELVKEAGLIGFRYFELCESDFLRKIFGPKRDEVTGEWRKLHNEELKSFVLIPRYH
jgi:hypothetical protein